MSRMIPGRIRNQGIELYEEGLVKLLSRESDFIQAEVADHHVQYSIEDAKTRCDCELFTKKKYCQHLAALEYYLKNNQEGKEVAEQMVSRQEDQQETRHTATSGRFS